MTNLNLCKVVFYIRLKKLVWLTKARGPYGFSFKSILVNFRSEHNFISHCLGTSVTNISWPNTYIIADEFQEELKMGQIRRRSDSFWLPYLRTFRTDFRNIVSLTNLPQQSKILPIWSRKPIFKVLLHLTGGENNLSSTEVVWKKPFLS